MPERAQFTEMYSKHYRAVRSHVRRGVSDPAEADDIAAEVFEAAWKRWDPDRPFGRAWLMRVASRRVVDYYRHRARLADMREALVNELMRQAVVSDRKGVVLIADALNRLPDRDRRAIEMTYGDGLSAEEVGRALGCSLGATWAVLSRARSKLRDMLVTD